MTSNILFEANGPIGEIILNAPERRNALCQHMWAAIPEIVQHAEANSDIRMLILHGGQTGIFTAGADISEFEEIYTTPKAAERSNQTVEAALHALEASALPSIAALEGVCIGGGVSLAMAADIRIAAKGTKFAVPPAKLGLVYPASHTRRLVQAIGAGRTKEIIFSGRIFEAAEAHSIGLAEYLVDKGEALNAARELCQTMGKNSQWSIGATKQMIAGLLAGWRDDDPGIQALETEGFTNADFQEGRRAFLDKRPPKFTL